MDNFTLINTEPIASVANNLINKLATAAEWYVTHETPETIALSTLIKNVQNSNLAMLDKAIVISNAKKLIKEYSNQTDIIKNAIPLLNGAAKPENIDDDWIAAFMDKVRLISDKEFQIIWAKILAEECNKPSSISKQLLMTLSQMDKEDAETFAAVCNFSIKIHTDNEIEYHPIIDLTKIDSYYTKFKITHDNLRNLVALGLIDFEESSEVGYSFTMKKPILSISYGDRELDLPTSCLTIGGGAVILKKTGKELFKAITITKQEDFWDDVAKPYFERYWKNEILKQSFNKSLEELEKTAKMIKNKGIKQT